MEKNVPIIITSTNFKQPNTYKRTAFLIKAINSNYIIIYFRTERI